MPRLLLLLSTLTFAQLARADETEDLLRYYEQFDKKKMERDTKNFLTAKTVEEKGKFVRDPARVIPLMKAHYSKQAYQPERLEIFDSTSTSYRDRFVFCSVETGDFLTRSIVLKRSLKGGEEHYLIDWESWVGYSEKTPDEMKDEKPTTAFLVRAKVSNQNYYNYGFSDEKKWKSFQLLIGDPEESFTGYLPRDPKELEKLSIEENKRSHVILKVAYPENARSDRQVLITEVVQSGSWLMIPDKKAPPAPEKNPEPAQR